MLRNFLISFICLLLHFEVNAQNSNYAIAFNIKGLKKDKYSLAHYFGSKQYIPKATVQSTGDSVVFKGDKILPTGLYMLIDSKKAKVFEFLIVDSQNLNFSSDTANIYQNMKVAGSKQNSFFLEYQQKLKDYNVELAMYEAQKKLSPNNSILDVKMGQVRTEIASFTQSFLKKNKGQWVEKLIQAASEINVPTAPVLKSDKIDSTWQYKYYKKHFWDNFEFSEEAFVRTPLLQKRLDQYMDKVVAQQTDSLINAADFVINKAIKGKNKEVLSYCIWYLTNKYESYELYGAEEVFVHVAEKYYIGGIMPVSTEAIVDGIKKKVDALKPLLIGKTFPELELQDTARVVINIDDIDAKYLILYFYDPNCGHCKTAAPQLNEFYNKYKSKGVKIYAPAITGSIQDWLHFIKTFSTQEWINTFTYDSNIDYRLKFDVIKTPMVYVLGKDKTILARRIPVESLDRLIDYMETYTKGK